MAVVLSPCTIHSGKAVWRVRPLVTTLRKVDYRCVSLKQWLLRHPNIFASICCNLLTQPKYHKPGWRFSAVPILDTVNVALDISCNSPLSLCFPALPHAVCGCSYDLGQSPYCHSCVYTTALRPIVQNRNAPMYLCDNDTHVEIYRQCNLSKPCYSSMDGTSEEVLCWEQ